MKTILVLLCLLCELTFSASSKTTIKATVENVYGGSILLNWTEQKPIYGKRQSDNLVSVGNFLGGNGSAAPRPVIGYDTVFSKEILIVNYPTEGIAEGQKLNLEADLIGTTNFSGKTIELWDCGIIPKSPEQMEEMKEKEAKALAWADAMDEKKKAAAKKAAREKNYQAQAKAVHFLQPQATNGDASAQCELGLHYLNGLGCETNQEQGVYWLQKAAAQGDLRASKKLDQLKQQK